MFERLQKPFLTVETGEAYQPIRLSYTFDSKDDVIEKLNSLACLEKGANGSTWNWFWRDECADMHFESLDSFEKNSERSLRLGTFTLYKNKLYLNLPSFKRACLAVPFFHRVLTPTVIIHVADFINKVFGTDERLPHGFTELFKDEELDQIIHQRISDYEKVQAQCEKAESAEEALKILSSYTLVETQKRLPYAERYEFHHEGNENDPDVVFLSFYIFLRSRELVAIRRWFGNASYSLADAAEETVEQVFGGMDIDIID